MKMIRIFNATPRDHGFYMPGEFEPHSRCWMLWPERQDNWRNQAGPAKAAFSAVARAIALFEPVVMGVSGQEFETAKKFLSPVSNITLVEMEADDAWMRDVGPTFIRNRQGEVRAVDWGFNAWGGLKGGLYHPWNRDERIARTVMELSETDGYKAPLILEGGSIHVDGEGTLLTTEQCLLHPNRNPSLSRAQIESVLKDYIGVDTVIWLGQGVVMDETDGHVDNLCCFARPGEVLLHWTDDPADPQYEISLDALERLSRARDAKGRPLTVHKLHQPGPLFMSEEESNSLENHNPGMIREKGARLAASYVNFYMANGGIVMPVFDDPRDDAALALVQSVFPDRTILPVKAREILLGGGNIHCITQQQP
jgi:agmatine deiminase